jgi:hypothetical protein
LCIDIQYYGIAAGFTDWKNYADKIGLEKGKKKLFLLPGYAITYFVFGRDDNMSLSVSSHVHVVRTVSALTECVAKRGHDFDIVTKELKGTGFALFYLPVTSAYPHTAPASLIAGIFV